MSPEQAQALPDLDGRADLFSVGTILFECLAGRPPFTGETYEQVILAICMRDAPQLSSLDATIPTNVSRFVSKALARDRAQRFASADEMLAALHDLSPEEKQRVPAEPPANKTMVAGGAGSVNALAAANVTAPTPTSVKPFKGASTQIAGSADATAQATPVGLQQATALVARTPAPMPTPQAAMVSPKTQGDYLPAAGVPPKRSSSAVIATAVVAALLGVLATFAIISVLAKSVPTPPPSTASPTPPSASVAPVPPPPSAPALTPMPSAEPVVSASAAPPPPKPAASLVPAAPPKPKPAAKSLDISRDLP
jgi:serine/threonine-protein kinase